MNELKNFKKKKLAEFDEKYQEGELWYESVNGDQISLGELRQFISDLIDEMVGKIPKEKNETYVINCIQCKDENAKSFNQCRDEFLTNLNS